MRNVKNLALFVLMPVLVSTAAVADVHYVNPGESIQAAIDAADPGDEIGVAPGFYTENIDFWGKAIRLYSTGGPDVTIIDGTGRLYTQVVVCINDEGPDTILEGFTITGGNTTGGGFDGYGGGMYNENASPTVTNCTFTGNSADYGGGLYNNYSSPTVTNCTFSGNIATWEGGGMCNYDKSNPTVTNCTFSGNTAVGSPDGVGGGMNNKEYSRPTVTNCTFTGNIANEGGGMGNSPKSSPTVTNCTFTGNTSHNFGGGMWNDGCSLTITNCTFTDNTASNGGGMHNRYSSPTVTNCTFSGNIATWDGGGMCNEAVSNPAVTNCTFTVNTASQGGGMYNLTSAPTLANCILWDDSPDEIFDDGSSMTVTYSNVQGGWSGAGNIDADPLFVDSDGRLSLASPCIDAGSNAALPPDTADLDGDGDTTEPIPLDLDGNSRIFNGVVDMGAFEFQETPEVTFSGWVWIESGGDFGYSLDEDDLLYFLSFGPVWYYNTATSQWSAEGPVGWTYVSWPYLYESATSTTMFALPPADGLWVYHFRPSEWTVSPRIIPW